MIATALVLESVLKYGPTVLPYVMKLAGMLKDGKTEVSPADIAELIEYGRKSADDYLAEAGGPPPAAPGAN